MRVANPNADAVTSAAATLDIELRGLAKLREALQGELGKSFAMAVEVIESCCGRVVVTGIGKAGHIARKLAATLASTGTPALFIHPAEASHGDLGMIQPDDVVLALSWSGESSELGDIIAYCRRFGVPLMAMTSGATSALGKAANLPMILPPVEEACPNGLAPTTSATIQLVLGDALAMCLLSRKGFSPAAYRDVHPGGKLGARLRTVRDLMHPKEKVPLVPSTAKLSEAIVIMTSCAFGITGITDDSGALIGVLSDGDLRRSFSSGFVDRPVTDVMGHKPRKIAPDALAAEALALMSGSITSLFVMDEDEIVGLVHIHDLLKAGVV